MSTSNERVCTYQDGDTVVTIRYIIDMNEQSIRNMAIRAANSKGGKCVAGPITVTARKAQP